MKYTLFTAISVFLFFSCSDEREVISELSYEFVLDDSVKLNIGLEPQFVSKKAEANVFLAYTRINSTFQIFNQSGKLLHSFNRIGEDAESYNKNVYGAGIRDGKLYIQDISKVHAYDLGGNHLWSQNYNNRIPNTVGGNIRGEFQMLNDSIWVNPLIFSGVVSFSKQKLAILDTLNTVELFQLGGKANRSSVKVDEFSFEEESMYLGNLIYPNFLPVIEATKNGLWVAYPYELVLHFYEYEQGVRHHKAYNIQLDRFKDPKGAEESELIDPMNKISPRLIGLNSQILKLYAMEADKLFILYKTGIPNKRRFEESLVPFYDESKFFGAIFQDGKIVSSAIEIPRGGFQYKNEDRYVYLGDDKWMFLQENMTEKDYYTGYIYRLKPVNPL
ncbi:hypothetical protein [Roseivirga echinicomitans]|uniref:6-bladed beta-propeller n=1 Tax=Roseivirga echinicomitans TaxID=296218 RepID=A0A150XYM1_9BACT|nr:hypothetical protein [Roseivirga echinicomitans]KYG83818.1 hypothetical protein AWN68_03165 [Roseivirga echinicomitans]